MSFSPEASVIVANWPAPHNVRGVMTTRQGGVSQGAYEGFNLATHVGDNLDDVHANRNKLNELLELEADLGWMNQVHGNRIVEARDEELPNADGMYTTRVAEPVGVLVADCVPILMCDLDGGCVAAIHAGWKGLACGVLASAVSALPVKSPLMAWLGPAIGSCHYEVGPEVRDAFKGMDACFSASSRPSHWMMDMHALATLQLKALGVSDVYGEARCTYCDATSFYSYRRDGQSGRMAAVIWLSC